MVNITPEAQIFNWGTVNSDTHNRVFRPNRSSAIKSAVSAIRQGSGNIAVVRKVDNAWKIDSNATEEAYAIVEGLPESKRKPSEAKTSLRLLSNASRALATNDEYSREDIHAFIMLVRRCFEALDVSSDEMDLLGEEE